MTDVRDVRCVMGSVLARIESDVAGTSEGRRLRGTHFTDLSTPLTSYKGNWMM